MSSLDLSGTLRTVVSGGLMFLPESCWLRSSGSTPSMRPTTSTSLEITVH